MEPYSNPGRSIRFALTLAICAVLLLGFGALTVRYIFVDLPAEVLRRTSAHAVETAHQVAREVARAFQIQPKVTFNHKTIVEQESAVLELVTLEKNFTERQRMDDSWLQSTKTLEIEADFVVRAGFDLEKPFVIEVDRSDSGLRVSLPPAQILSVDLRDVRFLRDEDGFWNKLTPEDREQALRALRKRIESNARGSGIARQAREAAEKRLTDLLAASGRTITFEPENPK